MISSRSAVSSIRSSGLSLQSRLNWSSVRQTELTSKENRNGACCSIEGGRAIFASDRHHNPAFRLLNFLAAVSSSFPYNEKAALPTWRGLYRPRRGAGVAEQGCLLSSCSGKTRAGGSNPPLSAPLFSVRYSRFYIFQGNTGQSVLQYPGNAFEFVQTPPGKMRS